jgi:RND family efflux transporter MFP subunit
MLTKLQARAGWGFKPVLVVILIVAGVGAGGYFLWNRQRTVPMYTVQKGTVVRAFYATGTVRPDIEYIIKSKAQGNLVDLQVREGSLVKKDQLLARVNDRQLRFEVERAEAELTEAKAQATDEAPQRRELQALLNEAKQQAEIAQRQLERTQTLADKGNSSPTDLDNARRAYVQWVNQIAAYESRLGTWRIESQKRVDVAAANLRKASANLADTEVRAPVDGVILQRHVELQEVVALNQTLFLLADPADMVMKAAVDEEDVTRTRIGQEVKMQLYSYPEKLFVAKVYEVLPVANLLNKTYEVKLRFENLPAGLKIGMTGELNFIEEVREQALLVPSSAVMEGAVYISEAGKYVPRPVRLGVQSLEKYEVLSGLEVGQVIVLDAKQVAPVKLPPAPLPVVPLRKGDQDKP